MFREIRRMRQLLGEEECERVLKECGTGVLAVHGDDGYPYAVPVNYNYDGGKLYFHCAKEGHKLDAIKRDEKVSFCVTEKDELVREEFTTYFRSVIVFGKARILENECEIRSAIEKLSDRFVPGNEEGRDKEIKQNWNALCMVEISIDHMSGKEAIELVRKRQE